jgi:glycerophosphoryl diester phosphodiesterase
MPFRYDFATGHAPLRSPSGRRILRIGHSGAGAYAPPNSLRALELALEYKVDMVEFDVRGCVDGLVLSHNDLAEADPEKVRLLTLTEQQARALRVAGEPIATLDEALDLLKGHVLINLDMKDEGHEAQIAEAIQRHEMSDQILVSSLYTGSLRRLREALPEARLSMSYPEDSGGASGKPYMAPFVGIALWYMRRFLPVIVGKLLAQSQADDVTLYHRIITPGAVRTFHGAGVRVFAWTVDDLDGMRRLMAMEVDGITTNQTALFDQLA